MIRISFMIRLKLLPVTLWYLSVIHKDSYYDSKVMFSTEHIYKFHPLETIKDYDKLLRITT